MDCILARLIKQQHNNNCFQDTRGAVVRISTFLGKKLDDQTIDTIVDKSSFKNMKEDPQGRRDKQYPAFFEKTGSFIRKGMASMLSTLRKFALVMKSISTIGYKIQQGKYH